jgi:rhodanese-related sulfurtransferase
VRGPDEFTGPLSHIPGAVNIPLDALDGRLGELVASRQPDITLVCRTDKRSAKAAAMLQDAGVGKVRILRGGMESWHRAGMTVAPAERKKEEFAA